MSGIEGKRHRGHKEGLAPLPVPIKASGAVQDFPFSISLIISCNLSPNRWRKGFDLAIPLASRGRSAMLIANSDGRSFSSLELSSVLPLQKFGNQSGFTFWLHGSKS